MLLGQIYALHVQEKASVYLLLYLLKAIKFLSLYIF